MVDYVKRQVSLSQAQIDKLAKGKKVRLTHKALSDGNNTVYLTGNQNRKVETRLKKGVGADIGPFDEAQISHNKQHGGGFWDNLKKSAVSVGRNLAADLLNKGVEAGTNFLKDKATNLINDKVRPQEGGALIRHFQIQQGQKAKRPSAAQKKELKDMMEKAYSVKVGAGFFDDLWGGIKEVGKVVLPIAGNALLGRAGIPPVFGMGRKRGGKKKGGALGGIPLATRGKSGGSFRLP